MKNGHDISITTGEPYTLKGVRTVLRREILAYDPTPSPQDVAVTKRLMEIGELMGIEFLDHIIIGANGFVSMRQDQLI